MDSNIQGIANIAAVTVTTIISAVLVGWRWVKYSNYEGKKRQLLSTENGTHEKPATGASATLGIIEQMADTNLSVTDLAVESVRQTNTLTMEVAELKIQGAARDIQIDTQSKALQAMKHENELLRNDLGKLQVKAREQARTIRDQDKEIKRLREILDQNGIAYNPPPQG